MRKFLAALCSVLTLYAFVPSGVVVGSIVAGSVIAGSAIVGATGQAEARGSRGGGRSSVSRGGGGRSGGGDRQAEARAGLGVASLGPTREPTCSGQRSSRPSARAATTAPPAMPITGATRRGVSARRTATATSTGTGTSIAT